MARLRVGIIRYASVGRAIGDALGVEPAPQCSIGQGRITITFRQMGASRWPEAQQVEEALRAATAARTVLAANRRRVIRRRASRAIVVVYVDVGLRRGCTVESRWECVIPSRAGS